ncbi:MAG TPA: hypothetical protein VE467_10055 [Chryseolinea sp.]|nr:hypothetical protein [Chryseolinea sp.]
MLLYHFAASFGACFTFLRAFLAMIHIMHGTFPGAGFTDVGAGVAK